ncbi:hypothetical protein M5689_001042 [Euphorbia peplus]|nr:hypothetical protein M5689_001042 [Euphorbia peplus]
MTTSRGLVDTRMLLKDHLDYSWYLGEYVHCYEDGPDGRRIPLDPPALMFWGRALRSIERAVAATGISIFGHAG